MSGDTSGGTGRAWRVRRWIAVALAAALVPIVGGAFAPARAAEGDLDALFGGGDGVATSPTPFGSFVAADQVVQPDGKIVVVGTTGAAGSRQVVVGRFLADGTPDSTFQGGGLFATNFGQTDIRAQSVDLTIDDHIIVAGERGSGSGAPVFVARLNPNGVGSDFYVEQLLSGGAGGYTLGGYAKVIPTSVFPFQRIAVGMWNESNRITVRLLDAFTGALATASWTGGEAFADFGMRAVIQDLELSPDGSTISVSGHFGDFGANGFHHAGVGRIVTTTGAPDVSFAGDGTALYTLAPGTDDWAQSIAIDSAGRTLMAGNNFQGAIVATVARADANGALDESFGGGDGIATYAFPVTGNTRTASITVDDADRPVVAAFGEGGVMADNFSVLRFTTAGVLDTTFGGDGIASYLTCGAGSGSTPKIQSDGKVLLLGSCDGQVAVARFAGPPLLSNVALTVQPTGNVAASQLNLPLGEIDREKREQMLQSAEALQAIQSSPLRNTPLRNTPLRNTPLRNTPLRNTPLRNTPLRNTPLRNTSLPPVLLSDAPLLREGGWSAILNDPAKMGAASELLGLPPQSVTFLQLPDSALEGITLEDIDLSATPLRNTSVAATLFGATPLQNLPAPSTQGWCAFLAGQPFSCANGVNLATTNLFDLEAAGDNLSAVFSQPLPITAGTLHPDSPILDIRLNDMELVDTPIGDIQFDQLPEAQRPSLFACTTDCADYDLADMQEDFADGNEVNPNATLSTVFQALPSFQLTFGQLLLGLVAADELPFEDLPLADLLALQDADMASYFVDFDIACSASSNVVIDLDLPAGFTPVSGTATRTTNVESENVPVPDAVVQEGNVWRFSLGASPLCGGTTRHFTFDVLVEMPSHSLGIHDASVAVSSSSAEAVETEGADLRFFDGEDVESDQSVSPDVLYTGHISGASDVDGFVMPAPPEGSTVEVMLSNLPADYDLVLYGSDDPDATPLRNTPLRNTPLRNTPLRNTPVGDEGLEAAVGGAVEVAPETLQDVPLRNTPLRNTSLQRDLSNEKVTTTILESDVGHELTIQVSGFNGASSDLPYVLRVRVTPPEADLECMPARTLGTDGSPGTLPSAAAIPASTKSLFLVNKDRLGDMYGDFDANTDWGQKVVDELTALAARSDVQGAVLPVEGNAAVAAAYADWDAEPCSVEAANNVVAAINAVVDGYRSQLSELRHIVLVGADEALPLARVADRTTLSNQRDYRSDAAVGGVDNPISRAFARGYLLSDDPYGDFDPSEWLDGKLYLPDVGLGRLVEHPREIVGSVARYVAANGQLDLSSSFTAGYDFLKDGATEVDTALRRSGQSGPSSLINDIWTRQDVVDAWNGISRDGNGAPVQGVEPRAVSVNAHYDHYRALPAHGDSSGDASPELLSTADLTAAGLPVNALLFGMGCQGGLNIPDVFATLGNEAKAADWAQTATQQGALYAGNTGYGYGDTDVSAYSERVYSFFAEGLDGTMTVGQAMTLAKHRYIRGLGVAGVYDAKAVEEAVFYGLPMFRLGAGEGASIMPAPETPAPPAPMVEETPFDTAPVTTAVSVDRGTYHVVPGQDPQVTHYRPIQPRMEVPIQPITGLRAHGAVLEAVTTKDIAGSTGVDPVYSLPTRDLSANEPEPGIDAGIFPTTLQNVTHTATPAGRRDTLVLLPGQFFNTLDDGYADGFGVQRLFTNMDGQVLHSDSDDFLAATIELVTAHTLAGSALFSMRLDDPNATRAVVLYLDDAAVPNADGSFDWKRAELTESPTEDGLWLGFGPLSPGSTEIRQWMGQAVDPAGNVSVTTNKGRYFDGGPLPDPVASGLDIELSEAPRADGTFAPGVVASPVAPAEVTLERSIDGGTFRRNGEPVTFTDPGVHTITYRGSDGSSAERTLVVTDVEALLDFNITVPTDGQAFLVGSSVTPEFSCLGPAVTCTASASPLDTSPGRHTVTFTATSARGQSVSRTVTYYAHYTFTGFFSPVNNAPTYNAMKAGSTAPVKFKLASATGAVSALSAVPTIASQRVDCVSGAPVDAVESTTTALTSSLHYDTVAGQYVYNWKTTKAWANTCRMLSFTFDDGRTEFALFQLK